MRCLIRSHRRDYKLPLPNEEAEQVGGLEPDPRYIRCCSAVCRPGYALRDVFLGLLVLLGLAVVVAVIFVVCFYVIPDEKQLMDEGILSATAIGVIGGPEHGNEVTLRGEDKYTLPPHNFDDGGTGGDFGDRHEGLSQDFSTFASPSGGVQDTTDPAVYLQEENPEGESAQDLPVVHHEDRVPEESLEPRENFDIDLVEESNDNQPEPNVGTQDESEVIHEHGHFQRDGDQELQGTRVAPEESADYVALPDQGQEGCSPVQLPMCISSVPWTLAGSPNWLNHTSEEEMFAALPFIRSSLLDSGCSSLAPLYACSVLEPPCRDSRVLPPCRAFCEEVAQSCQPFVQGAGLPGLFQCSRYPDSADPSVCISAQQDDNREAANQEQPTQQPISESDLSSNVNQQNDFTTEKTQSSSNAVIASSQLSEIVSTSPTTFAPAPPINDLTTTDVLPDSEDSTAEIASPTTMSLADRLKFAMSKSTAKPANPKAPTERIQRHSVSPSVQTFSPINTEEDINSSGMSQADRLSTVTTERIRRFRNSFESKDVIATPPKMRPVSDNPTVESVSEETTNAGATGVMSLAELLALSNKAKPSPKPSNRAKPRRRIHPSGGNRLSDQLAESSVTTTESFDSSSPRFRFRGNGRPTTQTIPLLTEEDEEGEERRIPVRTVNEVPKIKFPFPMRNLLGKPIPFRTTAEPPTREELLAAVTARTVSRAPFSSRFVPSSTTTEETAVTETETTIMTTTTDQSTSTTDATTTNLPTTTPQNPDSDSSSTTVATTTNLPTTTPQNSDSDSSIDSCPELQCLDGKCIAIIQLNDGVIDCSDGSDEQDFGGLVT